ncbi:MAG: hypothetical protein NQ127_02760 [Candidatus Cardinium sp.]|nr:hypothetical protein [Candidatus Cardinium sp.]
MFKKSIYFMYYFACFLLLVIAIPLVAQEDKVAYEADRLENARLHNKSCKKLEGNVTFTFQPSGMVLTADKAYKYDAEKLIEAHGNVKIVDKEGSQLQADVLTYYPEKKWAILAGNVICASSSGTFYTTKLTYDVERKEGKFLDGGKLVQDQMVLTSRTGLYDGGEHKITFSKEVVLVDATYALHCDQLTYHTEKKEAYFQGATKIIYEDNTLLTEQGGSYLPSTHHLVMHNGSWHHQDTILKAARLEMVDKTSCVAEGNVSLDAKVQGAVIVGERATYSETEKEKKTEITGRPLLTKVVNNETMYLRADRFLSVEKNSTENGSEQEVHALGQVKLYQENLQGVADGAVYNSKSNTIYLQNKPIVWCAGYQITGENMYLVIKEEQEKIQLFVNKDLFMVSADPVDNYNQIKGQKMVAYFKEGAIERMSIDGNGESLYFVLGEKNELIGMNHIKCHNMEISMKDNTLEEMKCTPQPIGAFYPVALLTKEQMKLTNFAWYADQWPTKETIVKPTVKAPDSQKVAVKK